MITSDFGLVPQMRKCEEDGEAHSFVVVEAALDEKSRFTEK
jgi:hypothetical protein